jgi:hypothetical protein
LLVFLCIALLAWRIDSRVEQYCPSTSAVPTSVIAFFDANERNIATFYEAHLSLRPSFFAERPHLILDAGDLVSTRGLPTETNKGWPDTPPVLSRVVDFSVPLLPNPPPPPHA